MTLMPFQHSVFKTIKKLLIFNFQYSIFNIQYSIFNIIEWESD